MRKYLKSAIWERVSPHCRRIAAYAFALVLIAVAVLSVGVFALGQEEEAGIIEAISPHCASVGAQVTIIGRGFGGPNVRIAADGVPTHVITATGNTATFVVPAGVHLGPVKVTATNPGGHSGSISFRVCDLLVPEAWAGEWKMQMTYRDASTGANVLGPDEITAPIRTGERFGLATASRTGNCTGSVSDVRLDIQCSAKISDLICTIGNSVQLAADRNGDTISGSGTWNTTVSGICSPIQNASITIRISGDRLSLNQDLFGPPMSLVLSFVPFGPLIDLPCNTSQDDDGSPRNSSSRGQVQNRDSASGRDHEHEGGESNREGGQSCR